ncbi:MAG: adenylate/guanylate cyclase domain-containing protein [Rhizobiaceae bacterium]|nr:adenylate/guanylate cyclase domain-containing protein [Rhizobiaceae bacterium]
MSDKQNKPGFFSAFDSSDGTVAQKSDNAIIRWTDWALRIGIGGYERETRRRLFLVNMSGYIAAISSISFAINFAFYDMVALNWLIIGNLVSAFITSTVSYWHRFNSILGPLIMAATVSLTLFFFVSELGRDSGIQLNYIGGAAIAFIIFGLNHLRLVVAFSVTSMIFHLATYYLYPTGRVQWAIDDGFMNQLYFMSAISIILILGVIVWYAFRVAADAEARSERLLMNIFPEKIANQLRQYPDEPIADRFDEATILFADIVGFTAMSQKMAAEELVFLLNDIFSRFDAVGAKLGTEKIKTIGDAYMAVSGAPEPVEDHSERILKLAIGMIEEITKVSEQRKIVLDVRIGIASGPITAGVIGKAKFAYDVWAPTVNFASRLESHGKAGRIQVSQEVYRALKDKFRFEPAPKQNFKGMGTLRSWFFVA